MRMRNYSVLAQAIGAKRVKINEGLKIALFRDFERVAMQNTQCTLSR